MSSHVCTGWKKQCLQLQASHTHVELNSVMRPKQGTSHHSQTILVWKKLSYTRRPGRGIVALLFTPGQMAWTSGEEHVYTASPRNCSGGWRIHQVTVSRKPQLLYKLEMKLKIQGCNKKHLLLPYSKHMKSNRITQAHTCTYTQHMHTCTRMHLNIHTHALTQVHTHTHFCLCQTPPP